LLLFRATGRAGHLLRVRLHLFLAGAISLRELLRRHRFAVLFNQTAISVFARQAWIDLEHLDRFVSYASRTIQLLLRAPFGEHVAALAFFVGGEVLFNLGRK